MMKMEKTRGEVLINRGLNILIILFSMVFLVSLYTGIQTRVLGHKYNNFFGYAVFEVETGSMKGTINIGDWVFVKINDDVKVNDIVTYEQDGEYITHRIVGASSDSYITKGDANNRRDEAIKASQIVGRVVKVLPVIGLLRKTIFNPAVLISLMITLLLINHTLKQWKVAKLERVSLFKQLKIKAEELGTKILQRFYPSVEMIESSFPEVKLKETEVIDEEIEAELQKTSLYRVIPVDAEDVGEKYEKVMTKADLDDYESDEDELDKTSLFRVIAVDAEEVDETLREIAAVELKQPEVKAVVLENKPVDTVETKAELGLTKISLDLLNEERKKGDNLIATIMLSKQEEIKELLGVLSKDDSTYQRRVKVEREFIETYIKGKYYNEFKAGKVGGNPTILKLEQALRSLSNKLNKQYQAKKLEYETIIRQYQRMMFLIIKLERGFMAISNVEGQKEYYKKELKQYNSLWEEEYIVKIKREIMLIQKSYMKNRNDFLDKLETSNFRLEQQQLRTKKGMYGLKLEHNLSFSRVYSDYIIDKTYQEGIVAEDKVTILLSLLGGQLIRNMECGDFKSKYLVNWATSLYGKTRKLDGVLKMIADPRAKAATIIVVEMLTVIKYAKVLKGIRRQGYQLGILIDKEFPLTVANRQLLYYGDYLFLDPKGKGYGKVKAFIPTELKVKIITEGLKGKVGDLGEGE